MGDDTYDYIKKDETAAIDVMCVGVYDECLPLNCRQLLMKLDGEETFILEVSTTCIEKETAHMLKECEKDFLKFKEKFFLLTAEERSASLRKDIIDVKSLLNNVPCVSCRSAVDGLLTQLCVASPTIGLEPIVYLPTKKKLTLLKDFAESPVKLYTLLYLQKPIYDRVRDHFSKVKKNKRCAVHTLDSHKSTASSKWEKVWEKLAKECREVLTKIPLSEFKTALDTYLVKHKFCMECRIKVEKAHSLLLSSGILTGEKDERARNEFNPDIYQGLRVCEDIEKPHIHISCDDDNLIFDMLRRADEELVNSRRERHAKTMDVAQEEVVTCLGLFLHDRLHKVGHKMRAESKTWVILSSLILEGTKCGFETAVEEKRGVTDLELFCMQCEREDEMKEQKKEQKREKKRKKKKGKLSVEEANGGCGDCGSTPDKSQRSSSPPQPFTNNNQSSRVETRRRPASPVTATCTQCGVMECTNENARTKCRNNGQRKNISGGCPPKVNGDAVLGNFGQNDSREGPDKGFALNTFNTDFTFSDTDSESDESLNKEMQYLRDQLPRLKQEREEYREQVRQKWLVVAAKKE